MTTCGVCHDRPVASTTCCRWCADACLRDLAAIASLAPHFASKRAGERAVRYDGDGRTGRETPLPYDPRVTDCETAALGTLVGIARTCMDDAPETLGSEWAPDSKSVASLALWLREFVAWLATTETGPDDLTAIAAVRASIEALFDRRPGVALVGPCHAHTQTGRCPAILYVRADDDGQPARGHVTCPECGTGHDVADARARMHDTAADHQITAREAETLLGIRPATLARMDDGGYLQQAGFLDVHTPRGLRQAKTYRLGDIEPAHERFKADDAARRRRPRAKRRRLA